MAGFCAALTVVLNLGLAPLSQADTAGDKKKLDAEIAALRTALEDTSQDLAKAFVELHRTRAELPHARLALAAAEAAQTRADRENQRTATALAVAQANAAKATDALLKNARDSQVVRDRLGNLVRDDYQQGGVSTLSIALEATSPDDFTNRMILMDTVLRLRQETLRGLGAVRAEGQAARAHLVAVRRQAADLKVQAEAGLARATAARTTAAAAKTKLDLLYAAQSRYKATVAAKKAQEIANVNKMQAQSDSLARELAARARAAREAAARAKSARDAAARAANRPVPPGPPQSSGPLSYPVNAPVSSEFGMRFNPVLLYRRLHAGIDFAVGCGSPVHAAADGNVILTLPQGQSGGYGNQLVIDHGLMRGVDLTTTYNHLSSFVVRGGHVSRGQVVAYSGTTGVSTGCHLHFETRENGTPVNPRTWL
jgi:murein DD-endopeptidase MepM/ murein hydrolase activator NlpD